MAAPNHLRIRSDLVFNAVKIFSATLFEQRAQLGERVTEWIAANPAARVTEFVVTQSSDSAYHLFAITIFYVEAH